MDRTHNRPTNHPTPATGALRRVLLGSSILAGSLLVGTLAQATTTSILPTTGTVAAGTASIATNSAGTTTTITQSSARAVIDWASFSVSQGNSVVFVQPNAASATLNRVTGTASSSIAGQISSNGAVYLVNPNGIAITSTGTVNTAGGFVASTLDVSDANFMAGTARFAGKGSSASVSNAGSITAGSGAYVALLGGQVANTGTITVPLGKVALASGEQVTLNLNGGGFLQVAVPTGSLSGSNALVSNSGTITAGGGTVTLSAATATSLVRQVINMSGTINADSATSNGGTITLLGGDGGTVTVAGKLSAQATGASGNGGLIETSGARTSLSGISVNTASAHGTKGQWLIDPTSFTVAATGGDITGAQLSANLANANVTIASSGGTSGTTGDININDGVSWTSGTSLTLSAYHGINVSAPITVGGAGSVIATTNNGGSGGDFTFGLGNYGFTGSLSFTGGAGSGAGLSVNGTAYTLLYSLSDLQGLNASAATLAGNYALAGNITANAASSFVPIGLTSSGGILNYGNGFSGLFTGLGHTISGLTINLPSVSRVGLFGVTSGTVRDIGLAGGTVNGASGVGGLVGVELAGLVTDSWASSAVSGNGNDVAGMVGLQSGGAISNVWDSGTVVGTGATSTMVGGLVGFQAAGSIANASSSGAVSGYAGVGGLVGGGSGTITGSTDSGNVTGIGANANSLGGLVGYDTGMVIGNASATGAVSAVSASTVSIGGLVGYASGSNLSNVFATGAITGGNSSGYVGGLIGLACNATKVINAYATGTITAGTSASDIGGLVGWENGSSLSYAYASGNVVAGASSSNLGGLVGYQAGSTINTAYALGAISGGASSSAIGGLVGDESGGSIATTYASGAVSGGSNLGGLVGALFSGGTVSSSYWDAQTTGRTAAIGNASASGTTTATTTGATSLTTAQARSAASYVGWDFTNTWYQTGDLRPILRAEIAAPVNGTITIWNMHQLLLAGLYPTANLVLAANIDATATNGANGSDIWGSGGFIPLGTDGTGKLLNGGNGFTGSFNGQGYTIANLTINRPTASYVGLIGYASGGASITGINLVNAKISGGSDTGALVGDLNGDTLSVASASGSITGAASASGIGGLVGLLTGNGAITTALATDTVSAGASASNIGGLVGQITGGSLSLATASGAVAGGTGSSNIGGLVGQASGDTIANTYASGAVSGGSAIGGLIGSNAGALGQSYATGAVSGSSVLGGLIGSEASTGTITSSIWNTTTSGRSAGTGSGSGTGATGLTTAAMQNFTNYATTYAGWNFTSVWSPPSQSGQAGQTAAYYPQLFALTPIVVATPSAVSGTYGAAPTGLSGTALGGTAAYAFGPAGDSLASASLYATTVSASSNVGTYAITGAAGGSVGSADGVKYREITPQTALYTITPAPLTITYTAAAASRTYGAANPAMTGTVSISGLLNGATLATVTTGTASWSSSAGATSNVGLYAITGAGLTGSSANYSYSFVQAAGNASALTINPAALTITYTAAAASRIYGNANPALTGSYALTGLLNGSSASSVLSGTASWTSSASVTSNVGSYAITGGGLTANANYTLTTVQAAANASALSVTARALTLTPGALSVNYGAGAPTSDTATATAATSTSGLVNGDAVASIAVTSSATATSNVGSYSLSGSKAGFSSGLASNYTITYASNATGLTITPAPLTITYTANALSQSYGTATPAVSGVVSASGLVNGDTLGKITSGTASWSTGVTGLSNVGTYAITGTGLSGTSANYSYSFVQAAGNASAITVTPAQATITYAAYGAERTYGVANGTYTGVLSATGLLNGDTISTVTTGTAVYTSPTDGTTGVGKYAILGSGLVANNPNYAITFAQAAWNATDLTIIPRVVTVTANAMTRTYGSANPTSDGVSINPAIATATTGLVNGDMITGEMVSSDATQGSSVGSYGLYGSNAVFSSGSAANYTIIYAVNQWGLTITPAPLTLTYTATQTARGYGASNPGFTGSVSATGLVNGDTVATATAGGINWTTNAGSGSGVGLYSITGSGLYAAGGNYTITAQQAAGNATALTINPVAVTVTYYAATAYKTYGNANPTFGGTVAATGLVNGDGLGSVVSGTATFSSTSGVTDGVGTYAVTGSGLVGNSANYIFSFVQASQNASALIVTPRLLTLTANNMSIAQGSAIPTSDTVTAIPAAPTDSAGLVNGDTVSSITVSSNATASSPTGGYALYGSNAVFGTGSASNYTITYGVNQWGLSVN